MTCNKLKTGEVNKVAPPEASVLVTGQILCSYVRLWLPSILSKYNYKHMLYIDSDTMVTNSIEPALQLMEEHKEAAFFMAEEVVSQRCPLCGWYHRWADIMYPPGTLQVMAGKTGYNAGVIGVNVDVWNAQKMTDKLLPLLKSAQFSTLMIPLGDQDILNRMAFEDEEGGEGDKLFHPFPCEFNLRVGSCCGDGSGNHAPAILHANRGLFGTTLSNEYNKLTQQTNAMLEWPNERRLATSLWEASEINVSSLYAHFNTSDCGEIAYWAVHPTFPDELQ
jgi:hypothetical protein